MFNSNRFEDRALDAVNAVAGAGLLLAPWIFGFTGELTAAWNAWGIGAAITLVALGALFAFSQWEEWANLVLGVWAAIAPWALGFSGVATAATVHVVLGLVVAALAAARLWFTHRPLSNA